MCNSSTWGTTLSWSGHPLTSQPGQSHDKGKWKLERGDVTRQAKEQQKNSSLGFISLNHFLSSALWPWADVDVKGWQRGSWEVDTKILLQWGLFSQSSLNVFTAQEPMMGSLSFVCESTLWVPLCVFDNAPAALSSTALPCLTLIWTQTVLSQTSAAEGRAHTAVPPLRGFLPTWGAASAAVKSYWKRFFFL